MISSALVIPAGAASAEPCGASSYTSGGRQYVAYRNCGNSIVRFKAHIGGSWGWCVPVPRLESAILHSKKVSSSQLWGLASC
ncbi:hypothetical protein GCM10012289_61670 [Nonomuraea cavernae]|uniref:Uncharacterized protein n=1 Tax=Nonomuraea cavernae TaxID=2045107 RepID=A0A917ZAR9_9ACTN|nr:hypothetical protein GCM10012289_61670 [Nonomuraea cavernae]